MSDLIQKIGLYWMIGTLLLTQSEAYARISWKKTNIETVDQLIVPGYERLRNAARVLRQVVGDDCVQLPERRDLIEESFESLVINWQQIQHWRLGPVEEGIQFYRIQLWPDKRGSVSKQFSRLQSQLSSDSGDKSDITSENIASKSVALQGIPALERLLYAESGDLLPQYRCDWIKAIAHNLEMVSSEVLAGWNGSAVQPSFRSAIKETKRAAGEPIFSSDAQVAALLLNNLMTAVASINEVKLQRSLGNAVSEARPKRLELWRSQLTKPSLETNINALQAFYHKTFSAQVKQLNGELDAGIYQDFRRVEAKLAGFDSPIYELVQSEKGWFAVKELSQAMDALYTKLSSLPEILNLVLGFNAQDGD